MCGHGVWTQHIASRLFSSDVSGKAEGELHMFVSHPLVAARRNASIATSDQQVTAQRCVFSHSCPAGSLYLDGTMDSEARCDVVH